MQKLLVSLIIILLSAGYTLASNPQYETELKKIRTIKNAKVSILSKQIKEISENIVELELNETISETEKANKLEIYTKKLDELQKKKQKYQNNIKKIKQY